MKRSRYTWWFSAVALLLTITALATYREISAASLWSRDEPIVWIEDSVGIALARAAGPAPSFAEVFAADESWRLENARQYTLAELRARGDGRRTPRQQMQDRVYASTRAGNRSAAIRELERWVRSNPRDADALLWLARLLNDSGRSAESVRRYRQALSVVHGAGRR
jgi:tetratricopeptide (TPR) repeat protein